MLYSQVGKFPASVTERSRAHVVEAVPSLAQASVKVSLSNQVAGWRNLWDDGDDLARHAKAFIAERLVTP